MSTQPETIEFILEKLGNKKNFAARAMFGEYALYADGKVVALVCDDQLYVKILPASGSLEKLCEQDSPYPNAKLHYVVTEDQLDSIQDLSTILQGIATSIPEKKKKTLKKKPR
jgi:DNA transformation protein